MSVTTPAVKNTDLIGDVDITGLDHQGLGVARVDGKVMFIDGALPGERVRYRVRRRRSKFNIGNTLEVLSASPQRVAPACAHFGICGGCSLQHLDVAAQIEAKAEILRDSLMQIGKLQPQAWLDPVSGPLWGYRRKARLGVRLVPKKGGILVGFREKRSSYLTGLQDCKVLDTRFAKQLPALAKLIAQLSCPEQIPQIEVAAGDQQAAMVLRHLQPLSSEDVVLLRAYGEAQQLQVMLQPKGPDSIHTLWPADPAPLSYRLHEQNIEIRFGPTDFIQVNAALNQRMVSQALTLLAPQAQDTVLDLFCGLGNFTLPLARKAAQVVGIEGGQDMVDGARANAQRNGIDNVRFMKADLFQEPLDSPWQGLHFDKLLLDPPRSGARQVLEQLPHDGPARIVYVSCNPATLARDSHYLVQEKGYQLSRAGVLDMFPHTSHVESMAVFDKL